MFWILFLLMASNVQADEVFYNKKSGDVLFIADQKSVFLSDEDKVNIESAKLPANFDKTELSHPLSDYKYNGSKVVLNSKKIADLEKEQVKDEKDKQKEKDNKASAITKLKALGLNDDELGAFIR